VRSLILQTLSGLLLPLMLLLSVFLFLRGHDEPGGGFVGGLVASAGISLHAIANGVPAARAALRVDPRAVAAIGLLTALAAGLVGPVLGSPFLTGRWLTLPSGSASLGSEGDAHIGTPLLFDAGVYLVVIGVVSTILFAFSEED